MAVTLLAASSAVKVMVAANNGLPADFSIFNEDANIVSAPTPAFTPGAGSVEVTINRVTPGAGSAKVWAVGTGYPSKLLNVTVEALPNVFAWDEAGAVQVP